MTNIEVNNSLCTDNFTSAQLGKPSSKLFLNQARAGHRPARTWFLKIDPVRVVRMRVCVCVCVCVSAPEAIND